jgi:hypothetical protein
VPNHVENDLVIHGDPDTLKAFKDFARGPAGTVVGATETEVLSAHRFVPMPDEYLVGPYTCESCGLHLPKAQLPEPPGLVATCPQCGKSMKDWYNSGGYDWCVEHWGTKWGIYDIELTDDDSESGSLTYFFLTAWSPPIPVVQAMSKQFPSLSFALDYFEGGAGFMGSCVYENGQEVEAGSAPYHGNRGG